MAHAPASPPTSRRDDLRVSCDCPVTISTGGRKRRARLVDLSCGGARIAYENSRMTVPVGAHRVSIEPEYGDALELLAMPVWRSRFSYGVRFLLADEVERLAVAELMDRTGQLSTPGGKLHDVASGRTAAA